MAEYLLLRLPPHTGQEILGALYLDVRDRLIAEEELFRGTLARLTVEPCPILYQAILHRAASFILWHTHPSGDPQPSEDDLAFTRRMFDAGQLVNIPLVDHLILGAEGRWVSLCGCGVCGFLDCTQSPCPEAARRTGAPQAPASGHHAAGLALPPAAAR